MQLTILLTMSDAPKGSLRDTADDERMAAVQGTARTQQTRSNYRTLSLPAVSPTTNSSTPTTPLAIPSNFCSCAKTTYSPLTAWKGGLPSSHLFQPMRLVRFFESNPTRLRRMTRCANSVGISVTVADHIFLAGMGGWRWRGRGE